MKVIEFSEEFAAKWNNCCDQSSQAWLFHRAEWIEVEIQQLGAESHSFAILEGDAVIAVQPLYFSEIGLGAWVEQLLHSGFHRHTGLACMDTLSAAVRRTVRKIAIRRIEELATELRADRIQLNVQNLAPESFTLDRQEIPHWVLDHGFQLGLRFGPMGIYPSPGMSTCAADQIVDLSQTEETLFSRLEDSCRRAVRKAEAASLVVEVCMGNLSAVMESYFELAIASAKRTGESIASRGYFDALGSALGPNARLAIIFSRYQDQRIAGVLLGMDKNSATFLGGVSDPDFLHLRPNDFSHWSAIRWAKSFGLAHYRLGPIFPELPEEWPVSKVSRFKAKFGGDSYTTIQGSKFLSLPKYQAMLLGAPAQGM